MLRSASTSILRRQAPAAFKTNYQLLPRRSIFTSAKPTVGHRARSFIFRLGLLGGVIYLYNTSSIFSNDDGERQPHLSSAPPVQLVQEEKLPTVDEVREKAKQKLRSVKDSIAEAKKEADELIAGADRSEKTETQKQLTQSLSPEQIEEEAEEQGAFNEETGEINWDCPCLGGMAHGPCGTEFREAFSCFVFSKEEPKGIDCIDHFKTMQDCFRKHPEIYGEPETDEEIEAEIDAKLESMDTTHDKDATSPPPKSKPTKVNSTETTSSSLGKAAPADKSETSELSHPAPASKGEAGLGSAAPGTKSKTDVSRPAPGSSGVSDGNGSAPGDALHATGSNPGIPAPSSTDASR